MGVLTASLEMWELGGGLRIETVHKFTQVQLSRWWREPTPALIHYKADMSPVTEKDCASALRLLRVDPYIGG